MLIRISCFLVLLALVSCSTDFQLTTGGKQLPVVYSILRVDDVNHYVRVERLFVDEDLSPIELSKDSNSVFYDQASVRIIKGGQAFELEKIDASEIGMPRDSGIFLTEPNFLYRISDDELELTDEDLLIVEVSIAEDSIDTAFASVPIVGKSELTRPREGNEDFKFPLAPNGSYLIQWDGDEDASFFDLYLDIHLREISNGNAEIKILEWPVVTAWKNDQYTIEGSRFFNFLKASLTEDPNITRRLDSLDLRIDAGGAALERFIEINNLNTGITSSQVIPNYTNVENGLGLVSSASSIVYTGYQLAPNAVDSLKNSPMVEGLNFD